MRLENLLEEPISVDLGEFLNWAVAPVEGRKVEVMSLDGSLDLDTMKKERLAWRHKEVLEEEVGDDIVEEGKSFNIGARQILTLLVS